MEKLKPHRIAYIGYYIGGLIIMLGTIYIGALALVLGALIIIGAEAIRKGNTFVLTEKGIRHDFRFVVTASIFVPYGKIQDVSITQNILERIVGAGTIHINTAGGDTHELILRSIPSPHKAGAHIKKKMQR